MKIGGREINSSCILTLVLPREDGDIILKAEALQDFDEFDAMCPAPLAPKVLTKNGPEDNLKDKSYREMMNHYNISRLAYIVIRSLEINDIEWDTVDIEERNTWLNYVEDFRGAGFSAIETGRIINLALEANSLDEAKVEQAREDFLRGQRAQAEKSSGLNTEPPSTPYGPPVAE